MDQGMTKAVEDLTRGDMIRCRDGVYREVLDVLVVHSAQPWGNFVLVRREGDKVSRHAMGTRFALTAKLTDNEEN